MDLTGTGIAPALNARNQGGTLALKGTCNIKPSTDIVLVSLAQLPAASFASCHNANWRESPVATQASLSLFREANCPPRLRVLTLATTAIGAYIIVSRY